MSSPNKKKIWELLDLNPIGMYLNAGYAVMPEQSTVAINAHHPAALYFGMKSGFIPKSGPAPDEVIAQSDHPANPPEEDPDVDPQQGEIGAESADEEPSV